MKGNMNEKQKELIKREITYHKCRLEAPRNENGYVEMTEYHVQDTVKQLEKVLEMAKKIEEDLCNEKMKELEKELESIDFSEDSIFEPVQPIKMPEYKSTENYGELPKNGFTIIDKNGRKHSFKRVN